MARVPAAVRSVLNPIGKPPRALARRYRSRQAPTTIELVRQPHPWARAAGLVTVVLLGAWLGLLVVGNVRVPVGPMNTTMTLRPSFTGGTKINVSPLGALALDSHIAPVRLDVNVDQLDPDRSQALVDHPERLSGLQDEVTEDVGRGTLDLAVRSSVAVVDKRHRPRPRGLPPSPARPGHAAALALTLLAASGGTAYATWHPDSVLEPKFSGLLTSAPSLVGNARSIVTEFDVYQKELARLVTNVTKLYDATSTLPAYAPDPSTIRVLHVSDIHLNPASWKIIASLVEQYKVDVIVDSGDTMDHGTAAENGFLDPIEDLGAPYVWVRGNHDSMLTQQYLEGLKNVHVLDGGRAKTIKGMRFAGIGDPQFTPDRSKSLGALQSQELAGARLATALRDQRTAGDPGGRRRRPRTGGGPRGRRRGPAGAGLPSAPRRDGGPEVRDPAPHRGLHRRQRPARHRGQAPGPHRGVDPVLRPGLTPAPGLGRDRAGRPRPHDGRGQPPPAGGEPARCGPVPEHPHGGHPLRLPLNRFGDRSRHPICFSRPRRAEKRAGGPIALIV